MKVYDGASWITATSAGATSLLRFRYVATSGQTTFSGADAASATLTYTVNNIAVHRNGVTLDTSEYTASNGTSIVLTVAAGTGDIIDIIAFKSFTVADALSAVSGGTVNGAVTITGVTTVQAGTVSAPAITTTGDTNTAIFFPAADTIAFSEGGVEAMRIDSSGNVGIGTSSPSKLLQVTNAARTVSSTQVLLEGSYNAYGTGISFQSRTSSGGTLVEMARIVADGEDNWNTTASTQDAGLRFYTTLNGTSAEKMRIDSSGNLLVGRTSAFAAGQGSDTSLQVSSAGSGGIVLTNGSNALLIYRDNGNQITYFYNGSNQASLSAAGAWTNASDAKLKKEITTIKYGLDTVLATQPRSYKRVDVDGDYVGFVAQELKEQVPEVVFGSDTVQYSVDYGSLVAVAFKAIQELKALADTQASTITTLTDRITALENA
jgi:hypothetical protein